MVEMGILSLWIGFREFVKNNLPNLAILIPLLCVKLLLNNSLFLKQFVLIKEIIIANLDTLFFTNSLIGFQLNIRTHFPFLNSPCISREISTNEHDFFT